MTDDIAVLKVEARAEVDRRADPIWLRGVKYTFVTAIEACIDVAQHVCSAQDWGPPKDNGDAMAILGQRGVLDAALSSRCAGRWDSATCWSATMRGRRLGRRGTAQ